MRDVFITYNDSTGDYTVTLRENQVIKETRRVIIYHELGILISNWLVNGF